MFWITFATTKERVTPPLGQKTDVRAELRELVRNWPWVVLLIASGLLHDVHRAAFGQHGLLLQVPRGRRQDSDLLGA